MPKQVRFRCTPVLACNIHWCLQIAGMTQVQTALALGLGTSTVNRVARRRRFRDARPVPPERMFIY